MIRSQPQKGGRFRSRLLYMSLEVTFAVFQEVTVFQEVHVSVGSWVNDMQNNVFMFAHTCF